MSDFTKYYFIEEDKSKMYVLELTDSREKYFIEFYMKFMVNKEDSFFADPINAIKGNWFGKYYNSLSVEELTEEKLEQLLKEVGHRNVFEKNGYGLYDFYGEGDFCQLQRFGLSNIFDDPQNDFISVESVARLIQSEF